MLNNLKSPKSTKKSKRLGRGMGSGVGGHTVGRGLKGATARSGYQYPRRGFEGGQNPISRRLPKYRGFSRTYITASQKNQVVKLSEVEAAAIENKVNEVDMQTLIAWGLVRAKYSKKVLPKVLFDKEIKTKITFNGVKTSKSAQEAIEKAGGKVN